jgi:Retroviral aspartyl protease
MKTPFQLSKVAKLKDYEPLVHHPTIQNIVPDPSTSKHLTLDQKRSLGLCFKCWDKYSHAHKCKSQEIYILTGDDLSDIDSDNEDGNQLQSHTIPEPNVEPATLTLCTSISSSNHKTIKLLGLMKDIPVMVLIDKGSTHSFINPTLVINFSLPTSSCTPLMVNTASGNNLCSSEICIQRIFILQGHLFQANFRALHVTSYDIVLGIDWLSDNSPMKINWKKG